MLDNLALDAGNVVMVTRIDRLARSTRDLGGSSSLPASVTFSCSFSVPPAY